MVNYELPTNATIGLGDLLIYESGQIPLLFPMILISIYLVIALGGYMSQQRRLGKGSFAMWSTISGLVCTSASFVLFLIPGVINIETITILLSITLISSFWLLFDKGD